MGVADRVWRKQMETRTPTGQPGDESPTDSPSTALAAVEKEYIKRLRGVLLLLNNMAKTDKSSKYSNLTFLMSTLADDMIEELTDFDELQVRLILFNMGEIISWLGHGDNERLPEGVREFAETVQPSANVAEETSSHLGIDS